MPSETYALIWRAVRERRQLTFFHGGHFRETCPTILGYAEDGREKVFVYQFAGGTSGKSKLPDWRCLFLADMREVRSREGAWHGGTSHTRAQTCVPWVDVDVNIPETLTRDAPLPFGHPLLRRPRRGS